MTNIADAIALGLLSDMLVARLNELESQKVEIENKILSYKAKEITTTIDTSLILSKYNEIRQSPSSPIYKEFIKSFIDKIIVGKYSVDITLKTGLDIYPELDTTINVRRQEIYEQKKTA